MTSQDASIGTPPGDPQPFEGIEIEEHEGGGIARFTRADSFSVGDSGGAVEDLIRFLVSVGELTPDKLGKDVLEGAEFNAAVRYMASKGIPPPAEGTFTIGPEALRSMRTDIREAGVTTANVETAEAGGRDLLTDFGETIAPTGTTRQGGTIIPSGMELIKVLDPAGSDESALYYLTGTINGVQVSYEVGNEEVVNEMFGGVGTFSGFQTLNQQGFDDAGYITVGTVDEIAGSTESLQAQFERDLRSLGQEAVPAWVLNDPEAMTLFVIAGNEGWSTGRLYNELAGNTAFQERFAGLDVIQQQMGTSTDVAGAVNEFLSREAGIRQSILSTRGSDADVSQQYVTDLIGSGWQVAEVTELLELERDLRNNQEALDNINEVLQFQGYDPLSPDDMIDFLRDTRRGEATFTQADLFETINEALVVQDLLEEGIRIDAEFAATLTDESRGIADLDTFDQFAQAAARNVMQFQQDIDFERYGLDRDDLVAAAFGEGAPSGKTVAEVSDILGRITRERARGAQGTARAPAFTDALGRLRVQGFGPSS